MWQYKTVVFEALVLNVSINGEEKWEQKTGVLAMDVELEKLGIDGWEAYSMQTIQFPNVVQTVVAMKRYYVE